MNKKQIFIIIIIVIATFIAVSFYNAGVMLTTNVANVESKLGNLDTYIKRRVGVANSFYTIVRPLMPEQQNIFEQLKYNNNQLANLREIGERSNANASLAGNINQITIIAKENQEVRVNESYRALLKDHLESTALLVRAASEYNAAVDTYNLSLNKFPQSIVASLRGYKQINKFKIAEGNTYYRVGENDQDKKKEANY